MTASLTICVTSCRPKHEIEWILGSLARQIKNSELRVFGIFFVNSNLDAPKQSSDRFNYTAILPKPNIYQGEHRVCKENWWAKASALNTALCLCETSHILFLDDRGVASHGFMDAVRDAVRGNYIMCGAYEKRTGMKVENGIITHGGIITGKDDREKYVTENKIPTPYACPGSWFYGCVNLLPLEWALEANGWSETWCDGMGMEDCVMGMVLENNKFPIKYDLRAKLIEDRTPEFLGTPMKRSSQERWPNDVEDKAHKVLEFARKEKKSPNPFGDIRQLRKHIQSGGSFPVPDKRKIYIDWFSGKPINDFSTTAP